MAKSRARKLADIIVGAGIDIDGNLTFDGGSTSADLTFADGDKANFGDASDLQIYHTGSSSVLRENGPGTFYIQGTDIVMTDSAGAERYADFTFDGASRLYHDNSVKFATTSTGVTVTGTTVTDLLKVNTEFYLGSSSMGKLTQSGSSWIFNTYASSAYGERFRITDSGVTVTGSIDVTSSASYGVTANRGFKSTADIPNFTLVESDASGQTWQINSTGAKLSFRDISRQQDRLVIDTAGRIGIGTTSPAHKLHIASGTTNVGIQTISTDAGAYMGFEDNATGNTGSNSNVFIGANGNNFVIHTAASEKVRVDNSGRVGIGTTAPSNQFVIKNGTGVDMEFGSEPTAAFIQTYNRTSSAYGDLRLVTNGETMRLTSTGKVGIGTTTPGNSLEIQHGTVGTGNGSNNTLALRYNSTTLYGQHYMDNNGIYNIRADAQGVAGGNIALGADANLFFLTGSSPTERMRIDSSGALGLGTTPPTTNVHPQLFIGSSATLLGGISHSFDIANNLYYNSGWKYRTTRPGAMIDFDSSGNIVTYRAASGTADTAATISISTKIDASGNFLVGATFFNADNAGFGVRNSDGLTYATRSGGASLIVNRKTSDGAIIDIRKDGTTVGTIGTQSGNPYIGGTNRGIRFDSTQIIPADMTASGSNAGNSIDIGDSGVRFKDLHLNGYAYVGALKTNASIESVSNLTFWVANVGEAARIEQGTGNIGVGTSAPSFAAVNSVSSGIKGIEIFKNGTDTASALKLAGDNGSGTKAFAQVGYSGANATAHFANYNTSGTKVGEIVIGSTGNVGIGTASPSEKLHVSGRIKSSDGLLSNAFQLYNTGTTGFLIELDISPSDYAHIHGTIKLQQFNVSSQQIIDFSATTLNNGTLQSYAATADIDVTIKLFVYNSKWHIHVPSPSTYTDISAYIHLGQGYQGGSRGSNCIVDISGTGVPSSGVTGSVDIVAQKRVLANAAGNVGVGETSPNAKFHVKDNLNSTGIAGSATPIAILQNERLNTGSGTAVLRFDTNEVSGTSQFQRATIGAGWDGSGNYKGFLAFATNDTNNALQERMRINSSGKVGIGGTAMDGQRLSIEGWSQSNTRTAANAWFIGRGNGGDGLAIGTSASSPYATWFQSGYVPTIGTSNHYALSFNPHGGNVGIGTTSPNAGLEVLKAGGGKIRISETASRYVELIGYAEGAANGSTMAFHTIETGTSTSTERMRINHSGNVGIGTSSLYAGTGVTALTIGATQYPSLALQVNGTNAHIITGYSDNLSFDAISTRYIRFNTNGVERMRIDASTKNVGIGTSTLSAITSGVATLSLGGTNAGVSGGIAYQTNGTPEAYHYTQSDFLLHQAMSGVGQRFLTNNTEAMRIDTSGNLLVGKTSLAFGTQGIVLNANGVIDVTKSGDAALFLNRLTSDGAIAIFHKAGTDVGSIDVTASATSYNTSSDRRLKNNIVDAPSASNDIDAIQVRSFDWKVDGSHQKYGMVAQELQSVAPEAVTAPEGPEEMMGVDYSKLVPMLVKEIQSLRARVAELEGE